MSAVPVVIVDRHRMFNGTCILSETAWHLVTRKRIVQFSSSGVAISASDRLSIFREMALQITVAYMCI